MAPRQRRTPRPYGTGAIVVLKHGLAIRWWEDIATSDGTVTRKMRYENLGGIPKKEAEAKLAERQTAARRNGPRLELAVPTFGELASRYERDVLPTYEKLSTRVGRKTILDFHLKPRFKDVPLPALTPADIQRFFTELRETGYPAGDRRESYSAHSLHDIRGVLRAVLKCGLEWYRLPADPQTGVPFNPVDGVKLPKLKPKREKWALSAEESGRLIGRLSGKAKAMVALAIAGGMRRGEILALRLGDISVVVPDRGERFGRVKVRQAAYLGVIDTPKTEAGLRTIDVHPWVLGLIEDWIGRARKRKPEDLVFGTRTNRLENSNNILRRHVFPACRALGVPHATWLTFRRTFQTLAHNAGVPARAIADIVGHADVETQFIYIQSEEKMKCVAVDRVGNQLCEIVRKLANEVTVVH